MPSNVVGFPFPEGTATIRDTFTYSGTNLFNLSNTAKSNTIKVFLNGVLQEKDIDYILADTRKSVSFSYTLKNGWKIEVQYTKDSFRNV